jgi:hypothetical protein
MAGRIGQPAPVEAQVLEFTPIQGTQFCLCRQPSGQGAKPSQAAGHPAPQQAGAQGFCPACQLARVCQWLMFHVPLPELLSIMLGGAGVPIQGQ